MVISQGTASVDEDAIARHEPGQYSLVVDLSSVIMGDPLDIHKGLIKQLNNWLKFEAENYRIVELIICPQGEVITRTSPFATPGLSDFA